MFKSALDVQGHSLKGHSVKLGSYKVFHGAVLETDHGSVTAIEAPCASALLSEGAAGAL